MRLRGQALQSESGRLGPISPLPERERRNGNTYGLNPASLLDLRQGD